MLPGGFSYGDYLRCGAIARVSPAMAAVRRFADDGGLVLGICNGFQILCEAGLLPGVLRPNRQLEFVCRDVRVRVEHAAAPFTSRCEDGQELVIPVKHGEGSWYAPPELLAKIEANGQVALRYAEECNGSVADVAGVTNASGTVLGLMPHPEHAVDPLLGSEDGALVLGSLVDTVRDRLSVGCLTQERLLQSRTIVERSAQALEVAGAERDRPTPRRAIGRIGEAHQPLPLRGLEQLDERPEPPAARLLLEDELLYDGRRPEGCARLDHATTVARKPSRVCDVFVPKS